MGLLGLIVGYGLAAGVQGGITIPQLQGNAPAAPSAPGEPAAPSTPATVDDDAVLGGDSATVTIIEFTDYQCPFCGRHYSQTFGEIKKNYIDTGKVKYVVRDFPLSFHQNAQKAAEATECAGDQDNFWEMHDLLFSKQDEWSSESDATKTFAKYARDLKMNAAAFQTCMDEDTYADEVQKDMADGSSAGIDGTPGFWVIGPDGKGEQISGAQPYQNFASVIDKML
ncbi:MAG: DSBA oxidoreductase [Candidatus Peregrinibacteria bacterium Gr01-1014_25]|nr:MAG: DSBA oxidoreductase [Candidatus Peregrinibacteria bacterium Gr01-1014_25]